MFDWLRTGWNKLRSYVTSPLGGAGTLTRNGGGSAAGQAVTPQTALLLSAVYRGVRLYGRLHGTLPLGVFSKGGKRRKYYDSHPTHRVLHLQPNPEMTGMTFWPLMEAYRLLHGNAYAEIEWNGRAQCIGLWPLGPWRVQPVLNEAQQVIEFRVDGRRTVAKKDMIHIPNFSWCGTHGLSVVEFGVQSMGRSLGAQAYGGKFFENEGVPRGLYSHPGRMEKPARDQFRKEMRENNGGANANSIGILWEGMTFQPVSIKPEDAQALETSQAGVIDVCRWLDTPPHLLFELDRATYANAEQGDLEFLKYGVTPMCTSWEQELNIKLLAWPDLYCKHSFEGLLRADSAGRSAWFKSMRETGAYSVNDILEYEDMDPIGPAGDIRVVNAAYIPLDRIDAYWEAKSQPGATSGEPVGGTSSPGDVPPGGKPPDARTPPAPPSKGGEKKPAKRRLDAAMEADLFADPFFAAEWSRMLRRENKALERAAKKPAEFMAWMDDFYQKHELAAFEGVGPAVSDFYERHDLDSSEIDMDLRTILMVHSRRSKAALLAAMEVPADQFEASIQAFVAERNAG